MDTQKAIEILQERVDFWEKHYNNVVPEYGETLKAAISALQEKQRNDELRQHLQGMYGDDVELKDIVDALQHVLEEPDKPHPLHAKILTYEDAEKWERWKKADESGRLVELPCAVGDTVWKVKTYRCHNDVTPVCVEEQVFKMPMFDFLGKTVFTTPEAAQEALERTRKGT